jgi:hypothetical protein
MNKLFISILLLIVGNLLAWFQLQGQFLKSEFMSIFKSPYFIMLMGVPISYLFWTATRLSYEHFGQVWNIRMIGFGMGTLVFGILTQLIMNETPSLKTFICLLLALAIILIQVTNITE